MCDSPLRMHRGTHWEQSAASSDPGDAREHRRFGRNPNTATVADYAAHRMQKRAAVGGLHGIDGIGRHNPGVGITSLMPSAA